MLRYYSILMRLARCWYPTLDDRFEVILSNGYESHSELSWEMNARGVLNPVNTVTITEPDFDSATFSRRVNERLYEKAMQRDPE